MWCLTGNGKYKASTMHPERARGDGPQGGQEAGTVEQSNRATTAHILLFVCGVSFRSHAFSEFQKGGGFGGFVRLAAAFSPLPFP